MPFGAAKLNRMEDRWSDLRVEAIDNSSFRDRAHILEVVAAYERPTGVAPGRPLWDDTEADTWNYLNLDSALVV